MDVDFKPECGRVPCDVLVPHRPGVVRSLLARTCRTPVLGCAAAQPHSEHRVRRFGSAQARLPASAREPYFRNGMCLYDQRRCNAGGHNAPFSKSVRWAIARGI
jgi:hypothetical protein